MVTAASPFGVVLAVALAALVVVPAVSAYPTATWNGVTDTLACVAGTCHILAPPFDDARVEVGTSTASELQLTLKGPKGSTLALMYDVDGRRVITPAKATQTTAWLKAPSDRVFEVAVLDVSPMPSTGVRSGVAFTLTASYR